MYDKTKSREPKSSHVIRIAASSTKNHMYIVDSMHGKLARFLRILGQDVYYYSGPHEDSELLKICSARNSVLITGDRVLYAKAKKGQCEVLYLRPSTPIEVALLVLAVKYGVKPELLPSVSRCPYCNTLLITANGITLPWLKTKVYACPSCGNYYWEGRHWKQIKKTLMRVRKWMRSP